MNCGGGGDAYGKNNDKNKEGEGSATLINFKGALTDGYISGGNVEVRYSGLNVKTNSNANGEYVVSISSNAKKMEVFASGGIDVDTDEVFEGLMRSSFVFDSANDKIWTSPITTILASLVDDGKSDSEARGIINAHLGLESGFDLLKTNPMSEALSDGIKIKLFKATQQIQRVSEIIKDVLGEDLSYGDISKAIARVMASDSGSDNIKDILKSPKIKASIVAMISDNKKVKALERLNSVESAIASIVDIIDSAEITVDKIKLYSKSIELVSNSYELKAFEINRATSGDVLVEIRSDLANVIKTYTSLSEVNVLVLKAQALAEADNKVVSLYKFSRSINNVISNKNTISELINIHNEVDMASSVITQADENTLNAQRTAGIVVVLPVIEEPPVKPADGNTTKNEDVVKVPEKTSTDGDAGNINQTGKVPGIPNDNIGTTSSSLDGNRTQPNYNDGATPQNSQTQPPSLNNNEVPTL